MLRRLVGERLFTVLILAPLIIVGGSYVVEPTLERAAGWVRAMIEASPGGLAALTLPALAALVGVGVPAAVRAIYSLDPADAYLEALPIAPRVRLSVSLIVLLGRNVALGAAMWFSLALLSRGGEPYRASSAALLTFLAVLTLLQVAAALAAVRGRLFRSGPILALLVSVAALTALPLWRPEAAPWMMRLTPGAALLEAEIRSALGAAPAGPWLWTALTFAGLGAAVGFGYSRMREDDREAARQLARRRRVLRFSMAAKLASRLGPEAQAQLIRDLRLAARGFPRTVPIAAAAATVLLAAAAVGAAHIGAESIWAARLILGGSTLAGLSLAALAPLALAEQRPYFWIEKAHGAPPDSIWQSKLAFACVLGLGPALVAVPLAAPYVDGLLGFASFTAQAFACSVMVGSVIGSAAFETIENPVVGLILAGIMATACAGLLICFPPFFPLPIVLWAYLMHYLVAFAAVRAEHLGTVA